MFAAHRSGQRRPLALLTLLLASGLVVGGCTDQAGVLTQPSPRSIALTVVSGNNQAGLPNTELPSPLVVRATDAAGAAIAGQIVNFKITAGGGTTFAGVGRTDAQGYAREYWTLGPTVGTNTLEARAVDASTGARLVFATFTAAAIKVSRVTVSPSSATLSIGQSQTLTAVATDSTGTALTSPTFTWASDAPTVATVSSRGVVTAVGSGTAHISATIAGVTGRATITVPSAVTATADTVFYDGFESGTFAGWPDGYDPNKHHIITDASGAAAGSRYLDVTYPQGQSGGSLNHFFMPGYDSVYVRYYVRFDPTWQGGTKLLALYGSQTTNQWSGLGKAGQCPNGTDFFATMLATATTVGDPPPVRFYTYYPAMRREPDGVTCYGSAGDGTEHYYDPGTSMTRGVWHKVEFWVRLNAIGQANSVQRFWIDGVLRGEWSGIVIRTSDILRLNVVQLAFSACCGGAPKTQHLQVDEVLVLRAMPR